MNRCSYSIYHQGNANENNEIPLSEWPLEWPKPRTLTTPNAGEDMEQKNSHSLLVVAMKSWGLTGRGHDEISKVMEGFYILICAV